MAKGGKGGGEQSPAEMMALMEQMQPKRPSETPLQTTGWGGMGYNLPQTPQMPDWATGHFAMPWFNQAQQGQSWGNPQPQMPIAPAQQPQAPQVNTGALERQLKQMQEQMQAVSARQWANEDPDYRNLMERNAPSPFYSMALGKGGR